MKKYLLLTIILLCSSFTLNAAQIIVNDITKDSVLRFTPGISNMGNKCTFNWKGAGKYKMEDFFNGITSWSADTQTIGFNTRCINMKVDIVDGKLSTIMPYVNEETFMALGGTKYSNTNSVTTFSTAMFGTPFTIKENPYEVNESIISAGNFGTINYFYCTLPTKSLAMEWLLMAGIESEIAKGYVLNMTWVTSERKCAGITMTLNPELLTSVQVIAPVVVPMQCNIGCIPAP